MSGQLFAAIRRGKVKPGMADEFAKRVKRTSMIYGRMSAIEGKADIYVKVMPIRAMAIGYGALHATTASGRVRLAIDGGAKIAR